MTIKVAITPVASAVPFDNSTNGFTSTDVQAAIEEVNATVANTASWSFIWGRSGNVAKNAWLQNESVPSNKTGRIVLLNNAVINKIFVANEDPDILTVSVYTHDGDETSLTLVGSVTTAAQRSNTFSVSFPISVNKQIAIRLAQTSANGGKNMVVGALLQGTLV